jgi:lactate dehydrogenase-like 2-hydroxyacid dehydrogenase
VLTHAAKLFETKVRRETAAMTHDEISEVLRSYDGFLPTLGDIISADLFDADNQCKIIANFGVGYNHIDMDAAKTAGVAVSNTPGAVTDATADIAIMLMLMTARRASEGEVMVRDGTWAGWHPTQLLGMHLGDKTLGIIGMGNIGKAVAKRAHYGFGMDIVYYNRSSVQDTGVPARMLDTIEAVMAASDVVSLNIPGGGVNRGIINAKRLAAMKPTGILINTARGEVIDEPALIDALQNGRIGGAGLDVYAEEPQVPAELRALKNVSLLPHLGTASLEVRVDMGMMAVDNLAAFFAGNPLPNAV